MFLRTIDLIQLRRLIRRVCVHERVRGRLFNIFAVRILRNIHDLPERVGLCSSITCLFWVGCGGRLCFFSGTSSPAFSRCTLIDAVGHMIGRVTGVPGHMIGRVTGAIGNMIDLNGCLLASHGLTQLTSSSQAAETGDVHRLCVE